MHIPNKMIQILLLHCEPAKRQSILKKNKYQVSIRLIIQQSYQRNLFHILNQFDQCQVHLSSLPIFMVDNNLLAEEFPIRFFTARYIVLLENFGEDINFLAYQDLDVQKTKEQLTLDHQKDEFPFRFPTASLLALQDLKIQQTDEN